MKQLKLRLSQKKFISEMKNFLEEVELKEEDDIQLVLSICNTCEMKFHHAKCGELKKDSVVEILKSRMSIDFLDQTIEFICNHGLLIQKTCWKRIKYFMKRHILKKGLLMY